MRYFLFISYDGIHFHGSQIQGEQMTVQYALNNALSTILRKEIATYGASRTDEGVHALMNIYHFDFEDIDIDLLIYKLNSILPPYMSVNDIKIPRLGMESNCRFDAISRAYRYKIYNKKHPFLFQKAYYYPYSLDEKILTETAKTITQYVDFTTFCKRNAQNFTHICHIKKSEWTQHGNELHYTVTANRFLRGMVRALVGTQLLAGRGKISFEDFNQRILLKDCTLADFSVPGFGLYLEKIEYPNDYFI